MAKLQVVMPMAGRGQRYRDAGYKVPKPLIMVDGKPMFLRALDSIKAIDFDLYLIIREDTDIEYDLGTQIKEAYPTAKVKVLSFETRGATESVMAIEKKLDFKAPLLILDCDLLFESPEYLELIGMGSQMPYDGLLLTFASSDPRYSYVMSTLGVARQVKEKVVISETALIGAYYWKVASNFLEIAREFLTVGVSDTEKELYISHTFQKGIELGLSFRVVEGKFESFGTPEELAIYNKNTN
jgi:NDP-sugar pyrophosphorylase family protein